MPSSSHYHRFLLNNFYYSTVWKNCPCKQRNKVIWNAHSFCAKKHCQEEGLGFTPPTTTHLSHITGWKEYLRQLKFIESETTSKIHGLLESFSCWSDCQLVKYPSLSRDSKHYCAITTITQQQNVDWFSCLGQNRCTEQKRPHCYWPSTPWPHILTCDVNPSPPLSS